MMRIVVSKYGVIHYYATCTQCDFTSAFQTKECPARADVLRAVRSHIKRTGHEVIVESGSHTRYSGHQKQEMSK